MEAMLLGKVDCELVEFVAAGVVFDVAVFVSVDGDVVFDDV